MSLRQLWRLWAMLLAIEILLVFSIDGGKTPQPSMPSAEPLTKVPAVTDMPALAPKTEVAAAQAELAATQLWGAKSKTTSSKGAPAKLLDWSLSGVLMVGSDLKQVILLFKDKNTPPRQLEEGDALPNGDTIKEIKRDKVLVQARESAQPYWIQINRTGDAKK